MELSWSVQVDAESCPVITKGGFCFIMGPCMIEDLGHAVRHATFLRKVSEEMHVPIIYKSSYLKDNRTSGASPRGLGLNGTTLELFDEINEILPVITDVHSVEDVKVFRDCPVVSMLQIPAMLSRQTSLLEAAGATKIPVMIKKGQWMDAKEAQHAADKVGRGNSTVICERGTFFSYGRTVVDFEQLADLVGGLRPVVLDATHSVSAPKFAFHLAKAACAMKVDGIFAECHENPANAPSDGARMLHLAQVERFVETCMKVRFS